jgi:soluble lytic murein transglycosylase-like protein
MLVTVCVALLGTSLPCLAADQAVLRNGFAIEHESRALVDEGRITRLYFAGLNGANGFVDVATSEIASFEKVPSTEAVIPKEIDAVPANIDDIAAIVSEASKSHQVDADLIRSVIRAESRFQPRAVSRKGARGLMQLMPSTAQQLGVRDSFDARENIMGGTQYLRDLLVKYDNDIVKALAAYNAGANRVEQYRGVPPYRETRAYVAQIVRDFNKAKIAERRMLASRMSSTTSPKLGSPRKEKAQPSTPIHE